MSLSEKQQKFTYMLASLIIWAVGRGYSVVFGEAMRSDEQAHINALGQEGRADLCAVLSASGYDDLAKVIENNGKANGVINSLHQLKLAVDLLLFKDGKYLTQTEDYREVGEQWESMGGTWGGRFRDGNHFSLEHNGVK